MGTFADRVTYTCWQTSVAGQERRAPYMSDRRRIHQHWSLLGAWYRLADALGIALALAISVYRRPIGTVDHYAAAAAVAIIVY